ncbi:MAG: hypothetical protein U9N83_10090 [Thermodesulfobacteriota bacterium]|nr:hypothetical protein [Thermodesulfobacteriota bacterium]
MLKSVAVLICAVFIFVALACTQHKVEVAPVEIKPIHITIDVNVKVDKALDDFFDDIDDAEEVADETPSGKK